MSRRIIDSAAVHVGSPRGPGLEVPSLEQRTNNLDLAQVEVVQSCARPDVAKLGAQRDALQERLDALLRIRDSARGPTSTSTRLSLARTTMTPNGFGWRPAHRV